jgi:hypothetical protein
MSADMGQFDARKTPPSSKEAQDQVFAKFKQRRIGAMRMYVYVDKNLIVVETNLAWALPYWKQRKAVNKHITWSVK